MLDNIFGIDIYTCKQLIWKNNIDNFADAQAFARTYFKGCPEGYTDSEIDQATADDNVEFLNWLISDFDRETLPAGLESSVKDLLG